jgi:hypothetical protein
MRATFTLTVRKRTSGHRLFGIAVDSLDHAYAIAQLIARAPEYGRCYLVLTDWTGQELLSTCAVSAASVDESPPQRLATPAQAWRPPSREPVVDAYVEYPPDSLTRRR